jgi:two-component system, chemotaxis family, chemotaxis protein CheY
VPPARPTILVVEDDLALRQFYRVALELRGYRVEVATDGLAALRLMEEGLRPVLIVLDLLLPRIGGLEFARDLGADPARRHIPIIAVTGSLEEFDRRPFAAVLRKPVTADHVAFMVEQTIKRHAQT